MVWIDLEMTGLDPEKERIIEIATIITDGDLQIIAEGPNLIIHQPPRILASMDAWNRRQHKKSGLIEAVLESRITVKRAEDLTLKFIRKYCPRRSALLCGNSVHHDRRFLIQYMPRLHAFLHYRHVDVSTIKCVAERWFPKAGARPKKKEAHRALDDIRESIEELGFYRRTYFK